LTSESEAQKDALDHLGFVMSMLAEIPAIDRCRDLDEAQAFYNAARPEAQIVPSEGYITKLVKFEVFPVVGTGRGRIP
jgi:hypothetical protein